MGRPLGKEVNMEKICKNCAHWCICKTWATENGVCAMHEFAPPCKIGDRIYIPMPEYDEDGKWFVLDASVTDVGRRNIYCSGILGDDDDFSHNLSISNVGVDIFLTWDEAREYIKRKEYES